MRVGDATDLSWDIAFIAMISLLYDYTGVLASTRSVSREWLVPFLGEGK